jgi:uncharacterized protein YjbI with pentapeptide repeats
MWAAITIAGIVFCLYVAACYYAPKFVVGNRFRARSPKERAELEDNYRRTTAQVLGGAVLVLSFAGTWIKDHETLDQMRIQAANQQFAEAAKLVATANPDATAAGIYSFENVVRTREEYADPVARSLRAYIKGHQAASVEDGERPIRIKQDAQAALYVLGTLPNSDTPLDFEDMNIAGADFGGLQGLNNANFQGATLYGANFSYVMAQKANFGGSQMGEWESYGSKKWSDPITHSDNWKWEKYRYIANFDHANLSRANFDGMSVAGATFEFAILTGARFVATDVSRASFAHADGITGETFVNVCYEGIGNAPTDISGQILASMRNTCKPQKTE